MRWASKMAAMARRVTGRPAVPIDPWARVVVVFTRPEKDLRQFDIALGPCIPRPGRKRPFVGVTNQVPGEPAMFERLASLLLADPDARTWQSVVTVGDGTLATFSDALVEAMADVNREGLRRALERPRDYDWIFEPNRSLMARWMPEVQWPVDSDMVPGWAAELAGWCGWARISQERGHKVYCWSGPGFNPWVTDDRIEVLVAKYSASRPAR